MSVPTSTNLPRSDPTSDDGDLTDFDGAAEILRTWGAGLTPDPDLTVSQWADRHRMLSGRASAEPGRYRTARTPYMREIMDRLSPGDEMQRIVFMKAAQVGATEAGNNWIGFAIHQAPGPMLAVQPTVELAKRNSRQRIDPLIDESPDLRERVKPARSRDAGNTMLSKEFAGGILIMTGANSAVGLRSTPARYIFLDEVDAYPASADEEGDPVTLAEARSLTFAHRRKVFLVSTPTIRGLSRIEREYEASDQRRFFVPCPHCGHAQWLKFDRLRWQKGRPETAEYHCEGCDAPVGEHYKTAMLEAGEWRATAVAADPTTVGYHLSALYSPIGWLSWERIVRSWEAAQGSDEAIKAFRNTILGETWVETGEAPDWQRLYDRRERWKSGTVPAGGLFLTAGADVQKDRIEVDVWAWGRGLESWLVDHVVIEGGPDRHDAWSELTTLLDRSWPHERGAQGIAPTVVDADGNRVEQFEPGLIAYASGGKDIRFNQPSATGGYGEYKRASLHTISAGFRVPYELLTGDLSQVNYSSIRAGLVEFRRMIDAVQWQLFIPMLCAPVWRWFTEAAWAAGQIPDVPVEWSPPKFDAVDPYKDAMADLLAIRTGTMTLAQAIARQGHNPDAVLAEIAATNAKLDGLGLVLDSDPRRVTKTGSAQAGDPTAEPTSDPAAPASEPEKE